MARSQLRVYYGPKHGCATIATPSESRTPCSTLGRDFAAVGRRGSSRRTWLRDFEDDEITISTDLYEVILAYQHYRRPSA